MEDNIIENSKTLVPPDDGKTVRSGEEPAASSGTLRAEPSASASDYRAASADDNFTIQGKTYEKLECLSDNSGEAQVFLVAYEGQKMVLKIYYPNFKVKTQVSRIIYNADFEMIVRLYGFGKIYIEGVRRDYELMEYLSGGTLMDYHLDGDENKFRHIALQGAAALAYCHNLGIIHKDIKPSNFFFRDDQQKELVLGDFGISSVLGDGESVHRTTQARTPVYAAPEMYSDVIDGVVEITQAADYYSLGLTLLALWLGRSPFNAGERTIMHRKNEGRLPGMDDLPDRVRMIIKGLTTVNASTRWTYKEVERWFLGENPDVDTSSPFLKYKSFVVDPEQNLVAETVNELVPMLIANERIARGYLYGGRLAKWFESCGNTRVSSMLSDIVTNKFPTDQRAGLAMAIYTMDPKWPYTDVTGMECRDQHSIAATILAHADEYAVLLRNPHDKLWIYVESHFSCDTARLQSYFAVGGNMKTALQRTALEIDPSMPLLHNAETKDVTDIVRHFGEGSAIEDDWHALIDGRLLSWMYRHADNAACEALKIMTEGKDYSEDLAYKVLYEIDRSAPYDLKEADTPERIGVLLANNLSKWQDLDEGEFASAIKDFSSQSGRLAYYARLHGWTTLLEQMERCFDLDSEENHDRLGAYDLRTAAYRFCRILGKVPFYFLPSGAVLTDGRNIEEKYYSELRSEAGRGCFTQWLSVFYHENPEADFSVEYEYERALGNWLKAIGIILPRQVYYRRFIKAREEIKKKNEEFQNSYQDAIKRVAIWKRVSQILACLWLLTTIICWIAGKPYHFGGGYSSAMLPVGIASAMLAGKHAYFHGYGTMMTGVWAVGGFLSSLLPMWILRGVEASAPLALMPAVLAISAVYIILCYLTSNQKANNGDSEMVAELIDDDVKTMLLEPLYYTFKTKSHHYSGSKFSAMDNLRDHYTSVTTEAFIHYLLWSLMTLALVMEALAYVL